jgi:uncharacterized protein (TIGR02302 family)
MTHSAAIRPPGGDDIEKAVETRIARAIRRARAALLWEQLWPLIAPFLTLAALFAALSWFGLWRITSGPVRLVILALFAAATLGFAWRGLRFARPTQAAAFARVERATGILHRPARAVTDRIASRSDDAFGRALWEAHRQRMLTSLDRLRAGSPSPRLDGRDPYAIRFLVALLFVIGFIVAGPERISRLGEAFQGGETTAAAIARIDAWVTPPAYTGRPPMFLTGDASKPLGTVYSVPVGSVVTVRTGGTQGLAVVHSDGARTAPVPPSAQKLTAAATGDAVPPLEHNVTLTHAGSVSVDKSGREIAGWKFTVVPDNPPQIAFVGQPRAEASGALALSYSLEDDYGVVAAHGEITPLTDPAKGKAHPLYDAPTLPLSLPQMRVRNGTGQTISDLTAHPWAGARVKLTLVATDEAKQEGRSASVTLTLPMRQFGNPLARAVVEQRARLALDANAAGDVADALDALTVAPEKIGNVGNYLALRSAYFRLVHAHGDNELRGVVDYLWQIALGIEGGNLSQVAQSLRDAQDALQKALQNNASDQEIKRLTENLRQAMRQFLQALAEQARKNPQANTLPPNANVQALRPQDLERMLNRIENLAQTGARDAARQMLSELQNMLNNLQAGMPQQGNQQANQGMQSLNQLGDMIRKQEELMNRTYRADQGQNPDGSGKPMTKQQLQQALRELQQQQQGLQQRLGDLMKQLQSQGLGPSGKLDQAGRAMGRAEGSLGKGQTGPAVGSQGQALEAMRQGAQGLSQQLANQQGQGRGGGVYGGDNFPNTDPLGRPQHALGPDLGTTVKVPNEIDTQRAREILDAIRKRLGDSYRPQLERDYLERLLEQF